MKINLAGRTDTKDYFSLSGIRESTRLKHHPFIVFVETENEITIEIVNNPKKDYYVI